MRQPLLQYYTDETFGYDIYDEERKLQDDVDILDEQYPEESREDFFTRIGVAPESDEYGSQLDLDIDANDSDWETRMSVVEQEYALARFFDDEDIRVELAARARMADKFMLMYSDEELLKMFENIVGQGYSPERLANSNDKIVRKFADRVVKAAIRANTKAGDSLEEFVSSYAA